MIDIQTIMQNLAVQRPVFHSEADYQHALAWAIHESDPSIEIRLEYPFDTENSRWHLDLWLMRGDERCAIELKYYTKTLDALLNDEKYRLRDHAADDLLRYSFCNDIERLETVCNLTKNSNGFAILLTNSPRLWLPPKGERETNDTQFLVYEGRVLDGTLEWGPNTGTGTRKGHEEPIRLDGCYNLTWADYSEMEGVKNGAFRYVAIQIS
jgi:hypothetical protein